MKHKIKNIQEEISMASKRTLEERIYEKNEMMEKALEKARQYEAQVKQLEKQQKEADRKARTKRLIQIGAIVEKELGRDFVDDDFRRLSYFLKMQERNGKYFSKAMEKDLPPEKEADDKSEGSPDE